MTRPALDEPAGAPPPSTARATSTAPPDLPSRSDATARHASNGIGGAWGRHAGVMVGSWLTPTRVLLAFTCLTVLLGFVQKAPCASGDWVGSKQYTHMCYSDVVPLWSAERLDIGAVPYRDTSIEYPVLTGTFMWFTGELTRGVHAVSAGPSELVIFVVITCLLLALCALVVTATTAGAAGHRPYDAALFALSPLLVFHAFSNWDLLAMAFASGALFAWARGRPVAAGVLIGLGAAAKLYPVFLLVPLWLLAIRTRRYAGTVFATVAAALAWLAVNGPLALAYRDGWWEFYKFSADRPTERSTVWAMWHTLATTGPDAADAPYYVPSGVSVALLLIIGLGIVVFVGLRAPVRPRVGQLAFLAVLAFLLTTKVWSPQYSLWLVPLLALARPRWRLAIVWQFVEIAVWFMTLTLLLGLDPGSSNHGLPYKLLMVTLLVRDGLLLALAVLVVRDMWRPDLDVVRAGGADDPAGGEFDGAIDTFAARRVQFADARREVLVPVPVADDEDVTGVEVRDGEAPGRYRPV